MSIRHYVKGGSCVFNNAMVNVLEYGKSQAADVFKVGDSIVVRFKRSIHEGAWTDPSAPKASHSLLLGMSGFFMETTADGETHHIAVVPMHQFEGRIWPTDGSGKPIDLTLQERPQRDPVKVVADISGGALHGLWASDPVDVLFVSSDSDDVAAHLEGDEPCLVNYGQNMDEPEAWNLLSSDGSKSDSDVAKHYHDQISNIRNVPANL